MMICYFFNAAQGFVKGCSVLIQYNNMLIFPKTESKTLRRKNWAVVIKNPDQLKF
jgi:hypothetical protein